MKYPKIECSNPHCDNYLSEDELNFCMCELCLNAFCYSCFKDFEVCENCGRIGCEDCIECDEETGFYFCDTYCKEEFLEDE